MYLYSYVCTIYIHTTVQYILSCTYTLLYSLRSAAYRGRDWSVLYLYSCVSCTHTCDNGSPYGMPSVSPAVVVSLSLPPGVHKPVADLLFNQTTCKDSHPLPSRLGPDPQVISCQPPSYQLNLPLACPPRSRGRGGGTTSGEEEQVI
jgi:hypothetical protein